MQQTLMAIPVVLSKREVIEIPPGKHEAPLSSKLDQLCVDGEPHKSAGPSFTPNIVRGSDELAKRQWFLPAIGLHGLKYKPGDHAPAIRCFPHAGLDESGIPDYRTMTSGGRTTTTGARTTTAGGPTMTAS